jgi:aquaporin Z
MNILWLVSEFFGTFALLLAVLSTGNYLVIGATLSAVIFLIGNGSGGHVNPAVSLVMLLKGTLDPGHFVGYIGAQLLGALSAYYVWNAVIQHT